MCLATAIRATAVPRAHGRAEQLVGRGRHFVCLSYPGGDPGADQPENRFSLGQSLDHLLQPGQNVLLSFQQHELQLNQRQRRERELHLLRREAGRHGRELHRHAQLLSAFRHEWGAFHLQQRV